MSKFVLFTFFVIGIISIFSLKNLHYDVSNEKFDFKKQQVVYENKLMEIQQLNAHNSHDNSVSNENEHKKVSKAPLVELNTDSLKKGHLLFKKCAICHGKSGAGKKAQKAPAIGGQYAWYIEKQIKDMKSGARINKIMNPYIKKLSEEDINDLSNYISKIPWKK